MSPEAVAGEDVELVEAVEAVVAGAREALQLVIAQRATLDGELVHELRTMRARLRASLRDAADDPPHTLLRRLRLLAELDAVRREIAEHDVAARWEALARIHEGMARLHECASPEELIEAAPLELCRSCGFSRAMISRVHGSVWVPEVLEILPGFDPQADEFRAYIEEAEIPLAHMLLETELVRRRVPVLVTDPVNDPRTFQPIVAVSRSSSYVAAPILPTRRAIGFFHADRYGQDDPTVTQEDRDNLWTFAEHFGLIYERTILVERLEIQRSRLREAFERVAGEIDDVVHEELRLMRSEAPDVVGRAPRERRPASRLDALVTAREREVLELMASGATNSAIAQQLVVSEGTVKSHVKRILRKLHVSNRAEAVARYLHVKRRDEESRR